MFLLYGYLNGLYFVQVNSSLIQSKLRSHYVYYGSTTCKVPTSLFFRCVAADDRVNIYLCQMFIWKWLLWLYWHLNHKLKSLHHTQCHHTCIMWLETYALVRKQYGHGCQNKTWFAKRKLKQTYMQLKAILMPAMLSKIQVTLNM